MVEWLTLQTLHPYWRNWVKIIWLLMLIFQRGMDRRGQMWTVTYTLQMFNSMTKDTNLEILVHVYFTDTGLFVKSNTMMV